SETASARLPFHTSSRRVWGDGSRGRRARWVWSLNHQHPPQSTGPCSCVSRGSGRWCRRQALRQSLGACDHVVLVELDAEQMRLVHGSCTCVSHGNRGTMPTTPTPRFRRHRYTNVVSWSNTASASPSWSRTSSLEVIPTWTKSVCLGPMASRE